MKGTQLISGLIVSMAIICVVSGQYFSSSDGVNLPRSGKRSYLTSLLKNEDLQSSSTPKSPESSVVNIDGPSYYQTDKLSFRRLFNKLGKRAEYYVPSTSQDYLTKEALFNYLYSQLHKLDHRSRDAAFLALDENDSSSASAEDK